MGRIHPAVGLLCTPANTLLEWCRMGHCVDDGIEKQDSGSFSIGDGALIGSCDGLPESFPGPAMMNSKDDKIIENTEAGYFLIDHG
jgi:hypothetical protein